MEFDPSKLPLRSSKANFSTQNIAQTEKQTITPLPELKLSLDKEYPAEVVRQRSNSQQASNSQQRSDPQQQATTQNQSSTDKTVQNPPRQTPVELVNKSDAKADQAAIRTPQANTWVLKVNDKFIEVKTQLALENLQKINIQLIKDANGKLMLQASGLKQSSGIVSSNPATSKVQIQHPSQSALSSILVKNLTSLLSEQISLKTGFNLIRANSAGEAKTPGDQNQTVQSAIRQLQNSLIKSSELASSSTTAPSTPSTTTGSNLLSPQAQLIKQVLLSSGLFFEKTNQSKAGNLLANLANAAQKLNAQYAALQNSTNPNLSSTIGLSPNSLPQTYSTVSQSTSPSTSPSTTTNHDQISQIQAQTPGASASKVKGEQFQAMLTTLDKLQSLISAQGGNGVNPASSNSADSSMPIDLKLNLLRAIISLNQSQNTPSKETNAALLNTANLFDDLLATSPFDFPKIQSEAKSKVNAILADKELSTGQLLKLMAAMLTRIQFNQLNSIYQSQQNEAPGSQSLFFEVPISNNQGNTDVFSLRIDQKQEEENSEGSSEKRSEIQWKIGLTFDLEGLGPLYIQVLLTPPSISSVIWAERPSTYSLIQQESASLKKQLSEIGLDVGEINCRQGLPEESNTSIKQNLVDIEA